MGIVPGSSSWQSFWELAGLALVLRQWASPLKKLAVVGDNTSSLQDALNLSGHKEMLAITREIAWRKARYGWLFAVGHLPTEANKKADALSRLTAPNSEGLPPELASTLRVHPAPLSGLWTLRYP